MFLGIIHLVCTQSFRKKYFLPPDTHTYVCVSGGKKCSFFGKFGVLCFLETPVLRFALLPDYRRIIRSRNSQYEPRIKNCFLLKLQRLRPLLTTFDNLSKLKFSIFVKFLRINSFHKKTFRTAFLQLTKFLLRHLLL